MYHDTRRDVVAVGDGSGEIRLEVRGERDAGIRLHGEDLIPPWKYEPGEIDAGELYHADIVDDVVEFASQQGDDVAGLRLLFGHEFVGGSQKLERCPHRCRLEQAR
ncbi:hypothetical protein [Streptomyces phaeoluteigriseus]|uniref:hypothetical protein n=1 Tax=Streptomyces phaeoluteigriseus TaxID=114686 RepID=UPI00117C6A87|nr:hypothetical protein [Streptomyces phaeoluteigriseus]